MSEKEIPSQTEVTEVINDYAWSVVDEAKENIKSAQENMDLIIREEADGRELGSATLDSFLSRHEKLMAAADRAIELIKHNKRLSNPLPTSHRLPK